MRIKGYTADVARVDKDGALAQSTEFMHTITNILKMTDETTGGYNSTNNSMVESPIRPIKRMTRSFLIGAAFPDTLWCFAVIYSIRIMNHRYNRMIKNLPIVLWFDDTYKIKARDIFIIGSKLYAITKLEAKN